MNKVEPKTYDLNLPIKPNQIEELKAGDIVYLSGMIMTARDHAHKRIIRYFDNNEQLPKEIVDLNNTAIYHCGPIIQKENVNGKEEYRIFSAGPTTSARMNKFQEKVSQILDVHLFIGKGGMQGVNFPRMKSVYLAFTGGCGAVFVSFVKKIHGVVWEDLGMPEAVWLIEVEKFGPLIVSQDAKGNNLFGF